MTILYRYEWNEVSSVFSGEKYNADEDPEHKRYIIRQQGKLNKYVPFAMLDKARECVMYSKSPEMKKNFLEQLKQAVYRKTEAKKKEYIALKAEADRYIKALEHEAKYTARFINLQNKEENL